MKQNILDLAIKIARKTDNKRYNFVSIITNKKGMILSIGMNSLNKSHPLQAKYANLTNQPGKIYLHSEIDALVRCKSQGYAIYTARTDKLGNVMLAKPCSICKLALMNSGINNIYST